MVREEKHRVLWKAKAKAVSNPEQILTPYPPPHRNWWLVPACVDRENRLQKKSISTVRRGSQDDSLVLFNPEGRVVGPFGVLGWSRAKVSESYFWKMLSDRLVLERFLGREGGPAPPWMDPRGLTSSLGTLKQTETVSGHRRRTAQKQLEHWARRGRLRGPRRSPSLRGTSRSGGRTPSAPRGSPPLRGSAARTTMQAG